MDANKINDMVDRKIIESLSNDLSISFVQEELRIRINNFTKTITKDGVDIREIYNKNFNEINPIRHRYGITYIKQCEKRISDLNWILNKKSKFKKFSNSKMFKMIQFKENKLISL